MVCAKCSSGLPTGLQHFVFVDLTKMSHEHQVTEASDAYMCQFTEAALLQIMVCRLPSVTPLTDPSCIF